MKPDKDSKQLNDDYFEARDLLSDPGAARDNLDMEDSFNEAIQLLRKDYLQIKAPQDAKVATKKPVAFSWFFRLSSAAIIILLISITLYFSSRQLARNRSSAVVKNWDDKNVHEKLIFIDSLEANQCYLTSKTWMKILKTEDDTNLKILISEFVKHHLILSQKEIREVAIHENDPLVKRLLSPTFSENNTAY